MSKEIFTTCPNCQNRMRLEFVRDIEDGNADFFNQIKVAEEYEGKCLLCSLEMRVRKPIK